MRFFRTNVHYRHHRPRRLFPLADRGSVRFGGQGKRGQEAPWSGGSGVERGARLVVITLARGVASRDEEHHERKPADGGHCDDDHEVCVGAFTHIHETSFRLWRVGWLPEAFEELFDAEDDLSVRGCSIGRFGDQDAAFRDRAVEHLGHCA